MRTVKQRYHRNRITFFISASALAFILADSASSQFSGLAEEEFQQQGTGQYWETEKTSPDGTRRRGGQHRHGEPAAGREQPREEAALPDGTRGGQHRHGGPKANRGQPREEAALPDGTRGGQHRHGGPAAGREYSGEEGTTYQRIIVQPGDTLYKIARRVYGDVGRWHLIYDANRDKLEDPNQVPAGVELIVPAQ
jgi:nucleoid-associated protein YgaU